MPDPTQEATPAVEVTQEPATPEAAPAPEATATMPDAAAEVTAEDIAAVKGA